MGWDDQAWMVRDLQALMDSPSRWLPTDIGCVTDFLGHWVNVICGAKKAAHDLMKYGHYMDYIWTIYGLYIRLYGIYIINYNHP